MIQKIYALSTARAGSKSVINKNVIEIRGKPLYLHNVIESKQTPLIKETYVTTDIPRIFEDASQYGFKVITRPAELCEDQSTHSDTIIHGLLEIEKRENTQVDILVVMLGNTMNMNRDIISQAIDHLNQDPTLDSVITVIKANHFNPIRAYVNQGNGLIDTFMPQEQINQIMSDTTLADKNSAGDIFFQNGLWILRRDTILRNDGIAPFPWLGTRIKMIEQEPHLQEVDDHYQIKLLI